jgi:hypothetical protein
VNRSPGDHGRNTTGWVRQADGTMIKKTSAWASWSSSSQNEGGDQDQLERVRNELEEKARQHLRPVNDEAVMPANVEPGFEGNYKRSHEEHSSQTRRRYLLVVFGKQIAFNNYFEV